MTPPQTVNPDNQNVQLEPFLSVTSLFLSNPVGRGESSSIDKLQNEPFKTSMKILLSFQETDSRSVGEFHTLLVGWLYRTGSCNKPSIFFSLKDNIMPATVSIKIYKIITLHD